MKYIVLLFGLFCFACKSSNQLTFSFKDEDYQTVSKITDKGQVVTEVKANRNNHIQLMKINYYPNGNISTIGFYLHDTLSGPYKLYQENGALFVEGSFKRGVKDGKWIRRDDSGRVNLIEVYRDGVLLKDSVWGQK